jgi:RimJ/RimL family protein N-acetyltransferase
MSPTVQPEIRLRRTTDADVRTLHGFELDEAANALAGTKPRDWPTFEARWAQILADLDGTATRVTPRVILADGVLVGAVNIAPQDGRDSIGYWIGRDH